MMDDFAHASAAAGVEARRWIARLASGDITADELERLHAWRDAHPDHDAAFRRERLAWRDLAVIEDTFAQTVPLARRRRGAVSLTRVAALVASLAVMSVSMPRALRWWQTDHASAHGQISRIALSDGSIAVLDSDTALAIDFDEGTRAVRLLKGRAWFQVRHGDARPFRVAAAGGTTEDIGTAFEVDGTGPVTVVGVTEGTVRVSGSAARSLTVRTGERVRYAVGALTRLPPDGAPIASWRNGELVMRGTPLDAAIRAVARYRSAPVYVWGDISAMAPVSGSFRTDRPDDVLATLIMMRGLERLQLPGGILVLRAGAMH